MIKKFSFIFLVITAIAVIETNGQLPLVYDVENTGEDCPRPVIPPPALLPNYPFLPDPFEWSDGSGRADSFPHWRCRRNEIKAEIEQFEIGPKPTRPDTITATFQNDTLRVVITENGRSLTLTSRVIMPAGSGPHPVVIGMNSPTGSLPASLFNGVIQIPFMHNQVVTYSQSSTRNINDPYFRLYPHLTYVGYYSAWSWGVSRLIDGIEIVKSALNADTRRIAVTGCSYAGKMALFAGAFDERIALTIVQESGGGGINSWRVSETLGNVEKIDNTNYSWFMESMRTNFAGRVGTLPHDHHELMAMIVPRALFVIGNPPWVWLGDESGYVSSRAVEEVYKTFQIPDRFGFSFRAAPNHCVLASETFPEVQAFIDKFLWGDTTTNTTIRVHNFHNVDYNKWIQAWRTPDDPNAPTVTINSPSTGAILDAPATITFLTHVTDINNNIERVIFFDGERIVGQDSIAPYDLTLSNLVPGSYNIHAEIKDSLNLRGYSNMVTITVKAPTLTVFRTSIPPVIDGQIDPVWNNSTVSDFIASTKLVVTDFTEEDLSGKAKMIWDDTNVYLLAEVTDDVKRNDSPSTWEDDNVEFYFDINNSKGSTYDANDVQYSFAWNDGTTVGVLPGGRSRAGIVYRVADTSTGYVVEAMIPWSTLQGTPRDGMEIGFDFMINDDDNGGTRDGKLSWNAPVDQAWQNASHFGTIVLRGTELPTTVFYPATGGPVWIHPNPAKDLIYVKGVDQNFDYLIFDTQGRLHLSGNCQDVIPISRIYKGLYILKIDVGPDVYQLKFVKE